MLDLSDPTILDEYRRILLQVRRQCLKNGRVTGKWQTTVGAVAKSVRLSEQRVYDHLNDAYLIILDTEGPLADRTIEEDGQ
jgi:hypothetical protein